MTFIASCIVYTTTQVPKPFNIYLISPLNSCIIPKFN